MLTLSLIMVLAGMTLIIVLVQKTLQYVTPKELKRRAQTGDRQADAFYQVVAYGMSAQVLLYIMMIVFAAGLVYVIAQVLILPLALLAIIALFGLAFIWLPNARPTMLSRRLTQVLAPTLAWLLSYTHVPLQAVGVFFTRYSTWQTGHTNLYQKEDLIDLLEKQEQQTDSRITKQQIDIAIHALTFGDKLVRDIFIPSSQVVQVQLSDTLGPVLMGELHKSGHSRFPVYDQKPNNIVGILYLHDLLKEKHGGKIKDVYQKQVVYVHEEQTLQQTLQAFLKTKRHLFIVVNRFEEVVGIVTIEDILEQAIGQPIIDEFDQYQDLRAVALRHASKIHKAQNHADPVEPSETIQTSA